MISQWYTIDISSWNCDISCEQYSIDIFQKRYIYDISNTNISFFDIMPIWYMMYHMKMIYRKRNFLYGYTTRYISSLTDIYVRYIRKNNDISPISQIDIPRNIRKVIYNADISEKWDDISWYIADISPI